MKTRWIRSLTFDSISPCFCGVILTLVVSLSTSFAGFSDLQLTAQPIEQIGDGEDSGDRPFGKGFEIVKIPYYVASYHGRPRYDAIAMSLTDVPEGASECNILARFKVLVETRMENNEVTLRLDAANIPENSGHDLDELAVAALDCIRIVAGLYHDSPSVKIVPPKGQEKKWLEVENKFKTHDKKLPFTKAQLQVQKEKN